MSFIVFLESILESPNFGNYHMAFVRVWNLARSKVPTSRCLQGRDSADQTCLTSTGNSNNNGYVNSNSTSIPISG